MAKTSGHDGPLQAAAHAAAWLDDKLVPLLGPPPLGPYDAESPHSRACPLCGAPLLQHRAERDEEHVFLHCPDETAVVETGRRVA